MKDDKKTTGDTWDGPGECSQCLKVEPGARPGSADSTPQAGPPRMRALGGWVGIESRPRNKYSLGTRARAFSGLLPHSWPCGSSQTLRSIAAAPPGI